MYIKSNYCSLVSLTLEYDVRWVSLDLYNYILVVVITSNLPNSSLVTSFEAIDRRDVNVDAFKISTMGTENIKPTYFKRIYQFYTSSSSLSS